MFYYFAECPNFTRFKFSADFGYFFFQLILCQVSVGVCLIILLHQSFVLFSIFRKFMRGFVYVKTSISIVHWTFDTQSFRVGFLSFLKKKKKFSISINDSFGDTSLLGLTTNFRV
jgi:hypothetical protein